MAKSVELAVTRDSISDPWPFDGTETQEKSQAAVIAVLQEYNGTLNVDVSEDGLIKRVTMMFPDDSDFFEIKERFEAVHNSTDEQKALIAQMRAEGKYVLSVLAD